MNVIWALMLGVALYAVIVLILSSRAQENDAIAMRLEEIKALESFSFVRVAPVQSFKRRIIDPVLKWLSGVIGSAIPTNEEQTSALRKQLAAAGYNVTPRQYLGRIGSILVLCSIGGFILGLPTGFFAAIEFAALSAASVYVFARFNLSARVTRRREALESNMPDVLDILSASVSAGLGFDQALSHVIDHYSGPLVNEFAIVLKEMSVGRSREAALQAMAERVDTDAITTFVNAIIQADKLGIPIANVLQTQAVSIRQYRRQAVEEKAAKLPVKIMLPLVGFIFPSLLVVLLGPAVLSIIAAFS